MDPHTQRAEAERWLGIAAKLLTARDFLGSKTFAIRAREADPNNAVSEQILAVVDTVLGGEKRLTTANHQPDWYAVLQLPRLVRDPDLIATHYRRLVLLLNPEHNRFPFADYALQLVMEAWSVLSEPTKKWLFDNELAMSLQNQRSEPQPNPPIRVDPVRVDSDSVAPSASSSGSATPQLNTFQFFQPPQSQPQTLPMWQQQPQQQSQREFMSPPPMSSAPQQAQQLLPQWQMRDPTRAKGGDRNKGSTNGTGGAKGTNSSTSAAPSPPTPLQTTHPPPSTPATTTRAAPGPPPSPAPPLVGVGPTPSPTPAKARAAASTVVNDGNGNATDTNTADNNNNNDNNNNHNNPTVASASTSGPNPVSAVENNDGVVEEEAESFWTACPYCFYIYEYQKMYQDCTLRCQNCRRGFHAAQIPNPPPIDGSGGAKDKDKVASFCCWGFFPLGFSMRAWKKHYQPGNANGSSNWVPFSPMFTCPTENRDGNFHWFANTAGERNVGRKGRATRQKNFERQSGLGNSPAPRVYMDDEAYMELSDPSDSDSSDRDWRNPVKNKKKGPAGRKRGRPRKLDKLNRGNHQHWTRGGGASVGGEDLEDGSEAQEVVVGLAAGARTDSGKTMAASLSRKQTRRSVKDMGRLDLNVEFNNEGEEHAPAVSAVTGEEDGMETIGFFEGLDEFLSTLPILNVGGDEKAKPS